MSNATYNANRLNRIMTARRSNPATAGYDDGFEFGFNLGCDNKPLRGAVGRYADPRWRKNPTYRAHFERAAREAHPMGLELFEDQQWEKDFMEWEKALS